MKQKHYHMIVVLLALLLPVCTWADREPYAVLSNSNTVLTFYYDENKESRNGMSLGPFSHYSEHGWNGQRLAITSVVFDSSFADCNTITSTAGWFMGMENLTAIIGLYELNTSNVTDMASMFSRCSSLTSLDLSSFDTGKVEDMQNMFNSCKNLTRLELGNFNTGNVTYMREMFYDCEALTYIDLRSFKTNKVKSMNRMFMGCTSLSSLDLSEFNTANVSDIQYMFYGCSSLTSLDLSSFDTQHVGDMSYMFSGCSSLTSLNISNFTTYNVGSMAGMFSNCALLKTLDLSGFTNENVTNMSEMFSTCSALTSIYVSEENWSTAKVTKSSKMFFHCNALCGGNGTTFSENNTDVAYACIDKAGAPGYLTSKLHTLPYVVLSADQTTLTFYHDAFRKTRGGMRIENSNRMPVWDAYRDGITTVVFDRSFKNNTAQTSTAKWFYKCQKLTTITGIENFRTDNVTNMSQMFYDCISLTSLDLSSFNTKNVTKMEEMFRSCNNLMSLDVRGFDTENVTDMYGMFGNCGQLEELDLNSFNTQNVTNMDEMFYACYKLASLSLSKKFDTRNVITMVRMFEDCNMLETLDLSSFNTEKVTGMWRMFNHCYQLMSLDVSSFNTGKVKYMNGMFSSCRKLKSLDLSGFNTANVNDMSGMFNECMELTTIYVKKENWNTDSVKVSENMFKSCFKIVGGAGTKYNNDYVDVEYARIDMPNTPGYLTDINKPQEELEPVDGGNVDFGGSDSAISADTDLDGNVVGNIYYNIAPGNGGYDPADGSIVISETTNMGQIGNGAPGSDDVKDNFTGIILRVAAGKGTIKVNVKTTGNAQLVVQVGNGTPMIASRTEQGDVVVGYDVAEDTYVYIYAIIGSSNSRGLRAAGADEVRIYGISVLPGVDGIGTITAQQATTHHYYTLDGRRMEGRPTRSGLYIVDGRKVIVK